MGRVRVGRKYRVVSVAYVAKLANRHGIGLEISNGVAAFMKTARDWRRRPYQATVGHLVLATGCHRIGREYGRGLSAATVVAACAAEAVPVSSYL